MVLGGTKWYIAMRWCVRGLGLVSSAILARLLVPEDFGLVATVIVIFGVVSLLFEFGVNWALIQNNQATDEHFYTAWTIRLLQSFIVALILAGFSATLADIIGDVRLELICQLLALGTFIRGFENIGVIKFQKDMEFSKDFKYNVLPKVVSTIVTIGLAYYFRSYMALVVGMVLNHLIKVVTSYAVMTFRPKISLKKSAEIWGFSKWILVRNIAGYISTRGDLLLLSVFTTPALLGFYRWATELSFMTITEIQQPFSRALIPGLVKIKENHERLINAYLKALGIVALISVPLALGFGSVAKELIPIFLGGGDKWLPVVPLIEGLVFFAMSTSMYGISGSMLTITGNVKYTAYVYWIQAIVTIASLYPAYLLAGLEGVAYTRASIGIIMFFVVSYLVTTACGVPFARIFGVVWRPSLCGIIMYTIILNMPDLYGMGSGVQLAVKIVFGAMIYTCLVFLLWLLSGKSSTIESLVLRKIKSQLSINKT